MTLVFLVTRAGTRVGTAGTPFAPVPCNDSEPQLFELLDLGENRIALKEYQTRKFLTATDDACYCSAEDIGPEQTFLKYTDESGRILIRTLSGERTLLAMNEHLIPDTGALLTAENSIELEPQEEISRAMQSIRGCCGHSPITTEAEPLWEEGAHHEILRAATKLLGAHTDREEIRYFFDRYWGNAIFTKHVFRGLKDADDKAPWNDNNWSRHFYNPNTRNHYGGRRENSALSEGSRYFALSRHIGSRIDKFGEESADILLKHAGYYLGLSLHFLTDLTQPMHAANFTNVWGDEGSSLLNLYDRRHAGFEVYADNLVLYHDYLNNLPPLTETDLAPFSSSGTFLHDVATESYQVFKRYLEPILKKKASETFHGIPEPLYRENFWRHNEAAQTLELTLKKAPYKVARYLANWVRMVKINPEISSGWWYKILEPTKAPTNPDKLEDYEVASSNEDVIRWEQNGRDNQLYYIMFNRDGTLCIGSRDGSKNKLWHTYRGGTGKYWLGHNQDPNSVQSRFRIIMHDRVRAFILVEDPDDAKAPNFEAVSVNTEGTYIGNFIRWDPSNHGNQLFRFWAVRGITAEERAEIQRHYPDFGKWDMWGENGVVPSSELKLGDV